MAKRNILDGLGNNIGELELPDGTAEEVWTAKLAEYAAMYGSYTPPTQPVTVVAPITLSQPVDSDNMPIVRGKVTRTGWTFNRANIKFETGVKTSLRYKSVTLADLPGVAIKFFNGADVDISAEDQATIDTDCVRTQVDFTPPYDNEIIAGSLVLFAAPISDMWLTVIGVPDIPAIYGGSKEFVTDEALHMLGSKQILFADGRASKPMRYDAVYHTNRIRTVIHHEPGDKVRMQMTFQQFKA